MKDSEKNIKIIEVKNRKADSIDYDGKKKEIPEHEKSMLMVFYSYLKNVS